ncbi:hypothetical protein Pmani_013149 [Petrolisthes manimaculis]|uniref:Uncharacterized protein n=1 Tax=Petrolisthes manimaculis TaxID=1843537 RepID=A0AAE1UED0_9EUCA|nr:hypothetical protein Pmani_013149 [Petrolisthes manimaculis]
MTRPTQRHTIIVPSGAQLPNTRLFTLINTYYNSHRTEWMHLNTGRGQGQGGGRWIDERAFVTHCTEASKFYLTQQYLNFGSDEVLKLWRCIQ